jgi:hypothetical protein
VYDGARHFDGAEDDIKSLHGYRFRPALFLVILLRAAFALTEAFFDFERFNIVAAPTTSAPAIAGRIFAMVKSPKSPLN